MALSKPSHKFHASLQRRNHACFPGARRQRHVCWKEFTALHSSEQVLELITMVRS